MLRENYIGWGWEVYIEMFATGIAAGAILIAAIMEFYGRGRSPIARTAHLIGLPLVLIATFLLIYKLERPERFWHMVIQSENIPWPNFQWWAPLSFGTWFLVGFSAILTISFVDALIDRGLLSLGRWRSGNTIHGGPLGKILAVPALIFALLIAWYSGTLINVNAVPGWEDTLFIAPLFIGISVATGAGVLLLVEAIRRIAPLDERESLTQFGALAVVIQLLLFAVLAISLGGALSMVLSGWRTITATVVAILFALVAVGLLFFRLVPSDQVRLGAGATLVLISGFLFRYTVVMGPQHEIDH